MPRRFTRSQAARRYWNSIRAIRKLAQVDTKTARAVYRGLKEKRFGKGFSQVTVRKHKIIVRKEVQQVRKRAKVEREKKKESKTIRDLIAEVLGDEEAESFARALEAEGTTQEFLEGFDTPGEGEEE